jgi:predicted nucleic acid-binding protein
MVRGSGTICIPIGKTLVAERVFLDTNVLVYADDSRDSRKQARARASMEVLIESERAVLSTQVLQEYFVAATRKLGMAAELARARVELFARLDVVPVRSGHIVEAIDLHRLHGFSFWDALVLRSAAVAGCGQLLTEDLTHGQVVGGVRIENPFL